jgi:CRISPR-associated protein Csd1
MSALAALARAYNRMAAQHEVPAFGYSTEKIGFAISLNADGNVAGPPIDLRATEGRKRVPTLMAVPTSFKRPGVTPKAFFLWDNTAFVLGVTASEGKDAIARFKAFRDRHVRDLAETDDEGLVALRRFIETWSPEEFARRGWPVDMKDQNLVFALEQERLDNIYIHDRPVARELWARLSSQGDRSAEAICLVSGEKASVARLHPAIKGVWGAQSSGASIVSFNHDAFTSYGHEQGDNAPVSEAASFAYTTALNRLLERDSGHRIQIGDASTVFWADAGDPQAATDAEDFFSGLMGIDDERIASRGVKDTLEKIRAGRTTADIVADLPKGVRFFILGLAPNAARLSIRFYLEDDFGVIARRYLGHIERLRIEPPPRDVAPSMWRMLIETAVLRKSENIQPNLAGEWLRAILSGTPYPLTLLSTLIMRLRADRDVNALRVAMLKSVLVRNFEAFFERKIPVSLDPRFKDPGYLLGRLFAIYEQVQVFALGRNVNATIKDKYYGAASAQPRKVFHLLESGSANHLSKIGKQKPGLRVNLEKQIGAIMDLMSPGDHPFPASLPDKSQALFGLGYYHQRNEFFRKADKTTSEDAAA